MFGISCRWSPITWKGAFNSLPVQCTAEMKIPSVGWDHLERGAVRNCSRLNVPGQLLWWWYLNTCCLHKQLIHHICLPVPSRTTACPLCLILMHCWSRIFLHLLFITYPSVKAFNQSEKNAVVLSMWTFRFFHLTTSHLLSPISSTRHYVTRRRNWPEEHC